jgi:WD40 repeat protein
MPPKEKAPKKPLHEYPDRVIGTNLFTHTGVDSTRVNSIHAIGENTVLSKSGNLVLFINYATGVIESMTGPPAGGIGAVAVHPGKKTFVVCEKEPTNPRIVAYDFPGKKQQFVLSGGAVQGYSACAFNTDGTLLASVAMEPDYMLTVWNWKEKTTVLRNKAFGSDVFSVGFSPFTDSILVTAGMGHIKFWTMASTFTGLKLQGSIGKFGRLEISDISGFAQFQDNKVVSGSESGSLLLWEGNLVKAELVRALREGESPGENGLHHKQCHVGNVDVVMFVEKGRIVMSGGSDGYIRYWNSAAIDAAETNGVDPWCAIKCLKEFYVGDGVRIRAITLATTMDHWVILDANGSIRKAPCWSYDTIMGDITPHTTPPAALLSFSSGGILSAATSMTDHTVVTGGVDGAVRLIDYLQRKEVYSLKFDNAVVQIYALPLSVDPTGTLFLCGFKEGSLRLLRKTHAGFALIGAWRPHSAALVSFAVDKRGTQVYSVAVDSTAFYFTMEGNGTKMTPIGYCRLPAVPMNVEWTGQGDACLLGFRTGNIIALKPPLVDEINHEIGYEFECQYAGLGYRQKQLPPVKEKKTLPNGEVVEESSSDDEDEDEIDKGPWGVNLIRRLPDDTLAIGLNKEELMYAYRAGTRYENAMGPPPIPATGIEPPGRVEEPMQNLCFRSTIPYNCTVSSSKNFMTVVCDRGQVFVRPFKSLLSVFHSAQLHDGIDGRITSANVAYDDSLLITTGLDGLVVAQTIQDTPPPSKDIVANPMLYTVVQDEEHMPVAPIPFSIQKQKEEDDRHRAEEAAMGKKQQMLRRIHLVHKEYEAILERNAQATGGQALSSTEIALDEGLLKLLSSEKDQRVADARLDMSWVSAKKEAQLRKLRDTFIDNLQFDRLVVHGFELPLFVSSFRTPNFTPEQQAHMAQLNALLQAELETAAAQAGAGSHDEEAAADTTFNVPVNPSDNEARNSSPVADADQTVVGNTTVGFSDATTGNKKAGDTTMNKSVKSQLDKAEERRTERKERRLGYQTLMSRKPKSNEDEATMNVEIQNAERTMGNYVLKTSPHYIIPEHLRPTAERKAKQLVLLEHSVSRLRMEFNKRLLGLRDLKSRLCEDINSDRARIREIASQLKIDGTGLDVEHVQLQPDEEPEKRFKVEREQLDVFEKEQEKERRKQEALQRAKKGFGADLATMEEDKDGDDKEETATSGSAKRTSNRESLRKPSHQAGPISTKEKLELDMRFKLENLRLSELEEEEAAVEREQLLFEKTRLERRVASTIATFDSKLQEFFLERTKLDADLCMGDMRVLLLFKEHQLLLEFKNKDSELAKRLEDRRGEQREITEKSKSCVERVNAKNAEAEALRHKMMSATQEAEKFIAENFPADAQPYLTKVYKRKIKRRKANEDDEDDDDEATSDDDDELHEEEQGDDGIDEEVCPGNCEVAHWETLLRLRERKLDCDDESADIIKSISGLKKESDDLRRREEQVIAALRNCDKEIHAFQTEKQNQLNLLQTIVALKLSQVQCLTENRKLPESLSSNEIIVFTQSGLQQLRNRIVELAAQKAQQRRESNSLAVEKQKLSRRKAKRQAEHNDADAKVYEVQLLKFGQKVDLELLEGVSVDRETEELKEALRVEELKWERELAKQNDKLLALKLDAQHRLAENTLLLKDLGSLRAEQHDVEHALAESTGKIVAKMSGGSKVATAADRASLKDLVVAQQQEIDALNAEIAMLRKKGGHVYTPVVHEAKPPNSA